MKIKFSYEFEAKTDSISFDIEEQVDGYYKFDIQNRNILLHANKKGFLFLAKAFIKMALNNYEKGFHFHLTRDFDDDDPTKNPPEVIVFLIDKKEDIPDWE